MTAPRGKIDAGLAAKGWKNPWATEQEAARLSGVGLDVFRTKVKGWEKRGFPQINPENGKRPIPGILAFWRLPANHSGALAVVTAEDEDGEENWNGQPNSGERLAS